MRILITDKLFAEDIDVEREAAGAGAEFKVFSDGETVPDDCWAWADGLVTYRCTQLVTAKIERLPNCRIVVRGGVGFDGLDLEAFGARGIAVCNVPDYGTTEVADHALALLLTLRRGIVSYHDGLRADPRANWSYARHRCLARLRGSRFGVVGLGRIGTAAARRARAFDMEVVFFDPYLPPGTDLATGYRRAERLEDLVQSADAVSVHTPLSPETEGLFDAGLLAGMKPGSVLINTSRGPVVDLDAVYAALKDGPLGGAALDVLPSEPPDDHPLIRAYVGREDWLDGRLILTPHAAFYSAPGQRDLRRKAIETIRGYLSGEPPRNCVNRAMLRLDRQRGYGEEGNSS